MKKIRYMRSSPQHIVTCIDSGIIYIRPGDVFKYYFSSSGADFWQGFLFSWFDELYVKAKIMKNSQAGCSFDVAYADTVDGGTSTSSFNYGDVFSITLKINDDYSGSIDIFNETRKQPITNESIQTDTYYNTFDNQGIIISIPSEGAFYKFEYLRDNQLLLQFVPAVSNNKAYFYDNVSGNAWELIDWHDHSENGFNYLHLGPEEYVEDFCLKLENDTFNATSTVGIDVRVKDIYGKYGPAASYLQDP